MRCWSGWRWHWGSTWCGVTLSFDAGDPSDRARIAQLYRVGRVVSQTTSAGRTVVEADVPRRLARPAAGEPAAERWRT